MMNKSTIAMGISAALAVQGLLDPSVASAATGSRATSNPHNAPSILRSPTGSGSVLYDQSGTAVNGAPSQNSATVSDSYDTAGADDFVVTDANGWDVSEFDFQVSATSDPSSATFDVFVYPDAGGAPGLVPVCSYSDLPNGLDGSNTALSLPLPTTCHLDPGTYWVSQYGNLDYNVGGQLFWSDDDPANAPINSPGVWQNPGDGYGSGCTTWAPLATCGAGSTAVGGGSNNFLFQIIGTVSGGGGDCIFSNGFDDGTNNCGSGGGVIDSGVLDIAVPQSTAGIYIDWLTGCTSTSSSGCANGYDFNPYGSTELSFYDTVDHDSHCVSADDAYCDILFSGDTIGAGSTFSTTFGDAAAFWAFGTYYLGFSFTNTDTGMTNYGYVRISTSGPSGVPMTLNEYWYDNTGADITIP